MYLLDTHVLLWYALDPDQLSASATDALSKIEKAGQGFYSSISIWELGIKIKNKKLDLGLSASQFARKVKDLGTLFDLPVTTDVWLENLRLDWGHRDPADRTIVATACLKALPVISKDRVIHDSGLVEVIW